MQSLDADHAPPTVRTPPPRFDDCAAAPLPSDPFVEFVLVLPKREPVLVDPRRPTPGGELPTLPSSTSASATVSIPWSPVAPVVPAKRRRARTAWFVAATIALTAASGAIVALRSLAPGFDGSAALAHVWGPR